MQGQGLAHAGTQQKQGDDAGALCGPQRVAKEVLARLQQAKLIQVKAKMEQHHPDDGCTTQRIHAVKTLCGGA
jgi:hypothetical protein